MDRTDEDRPEAVPTAEAVAYGRRVLQHEVDRLRKFELQARARDDVEAAERWRRIYQWIEWSVIGKGEGCVITAFDERWLNESFRSIMSEAHA